jgi:hypothetical protein
MKIFELFDKKIDRRINPAVVVSEMEEYFINQEIDEYVFTDGVTKNVYDFLDAIANKKEGKTGVWISGYYGSGKSHFIKYLFFALSEKYRDRAFDNFKLAAAQLDPLNDYGITPSTVSLLESKLRKLDVAEIIFNIDAVADSGNQKDRITRVLFNQLNAFRGYNNSNIALALYLEQPLDKKGHFEAFKAKVKAELKENWDGNQLRFARMYLQKIIAIAKEFDSDIDQETLKSTINDRSQDYSIAFFIEELASFLKDKGEDYRLVFLMDEVSQYIGSNTALLLNLQTIVEEIGSQIGTKVWVVCTAQQDLSNLINNTDSKTEDFGKILGRFETIISLESQDAAFITKKRVLDKKAEGISALADFYRDHKGEIENQFVFDHDLYENFKNRDDFTLTYPFIPYQFRLISDVFESFSNSGYVGEGVKNTERAILGITHFTANLCKDQPVGYFVPFDLFFNEQLQKNLTHQARGILDRAYSIEDVKKDHFAQRVVNALFMISNLGESQSVNFPANIENLGLLLMDSASATKLQIQSEVQRVLHTLVSKNIIQEAEGKYRFLKEDEIEVAQLIKSTAINSDDQLSYVYDDIISKVLKPSNSISFGNRNFKMAINIDEKEQFTKGDFGLRFSVFDVEDLETIAHNIPSNNILIGISGWLSKDQDLKAKIFDYIRTQKYIRDNSSNVKGTRAETLINFRKTNKLLLDEIILRFENKFAITAICSKNRVLDATEFAGATAALRFDNMVQRHMEEVYKKHGLSNNWATSNSDLITKAKVNIQTATTGLEPAEEELTIKLNLLGASPTASDVVRELEKPPYGWKDISTLDILMSLAKKRLRRFEWRSEEISIIDYAEKALNSRERDAITIHTEKTHSVEEVNEFKRVVNDVIFAESLIPSQIMNLKEAVDAFKKSIEPTMKRLNELKNDYETYPFARHLKSFHTSLTEFYKSTLYDKIVNDLLAQQENLRASRDLFKYTEEFIEAQFDAYGRIAAFSKDNKHNFESLAEDLADKASQLESYLLTDAEPWDQFPQMNKIYKDLAKAIKDRLQDLKTTVLVSYEAVFEEIKDHAKEIGISEANLTPDPEFILGGFRKSTKISQLDVAILQIQGFRAENLKKLDDFKRQQEAKKVGKTYVPSVKISIANEAKPTLIESAEQLDQYLEKLRSSLLKQLEKNSKIYIS